MVDRHAPGRSSRRPGRRRARRSSSTRTIGDFPATRRSRIRPRSALGLKYLELDEGDSKQRFADGDTVPLEQATSRSTSTRSSRCSTPRRARLAAEPPGLRRLVRRPRQRRSAARVEERAAPASAPRAGDAQPRRTRTPSCRASSRSSATPRASSPRSPRPTPRLFTTMADTWEALGRDPRGAAGSSSPSRRRRWTRRSPSFRVQRPFLADLTTFSKDFSGATHELRGALPDAQPGARDRHAGAAARVPRAQRRLEDTFDALRDLAESRRHQRRASAALTAHGHHAQPAAALLRPVRDGLQRAELLLHLPRRALLRARHAPARPSARCSTSPARRTTGSARWAPTSPPTARTSSRATSSTCTDQPVRRRDHARRPRRLRGRPARLPRAQRRGFYDKQYKIDQDARTPGAQGPTYTGRAARAGGRDVHRRSPRPARTRRCPRPRAVSDEASRRHRAR